MTKERMLWLLNMRHELPDAFSDEERAQYDETVNMMYCKVKGADPFAPMTMVEVVDDIDLKGGSGRLSSKIGKTALVKGNVMWFSVDCGFGPSKECLMRNPKAMSQSEMNARDGIIPYAFNGIFEYMLVFDYVDHTNFGETCGWWPHGALNAVDQKCKEEEKENG